MIGVSADLLRAAYLLLANSLEERKEPVLRLHDNHASSYAVAVIPLIVTALDAWSNEIMGLWRATSSMSEDTAAKLVEEPLIAKLRELGQEISGAPLKVSADLKLLVKVRDEIVHFLPYIQDISSRKMQPAWFGELKRKCLVITSGDPALEYHFSQMLGSYALAYWACETARDSVRSLASAIPKTSIVAQSAERAVANFASYESLAAPEDLKDFDARFGLKVTR